MLRRKGLPNANVEVLPPISMLTENRERGISSMKLWKRRRYRRAWVLDYSSSLSVGVNFVVAHMQELAVIDIGKVLVVDCGTPSSDIEISVGVRLEKIVGYS